MPEFAIISFLLRLVYFAVTLVVAVCFLRWFDKSLGISFKTQVWNKISENSLALAVYHGLRLFGVLYLGAAFLS